MTETAALAIIFLLATSGYAAGRWHGQFGYRRGYRYGYRQGYFDGDRASWSRRRRELQAAVASVLRTPPEQLSAAYPTAVGTTYTGAAHQPDVLEPAQNDPCMTIDHRAPANGSQNTREAPRQRATP